MDGSGVSSVFRTEQTCTQGQQKKQSIRMSRGWKADVCGPELGTGAHPPSPLHTRDRRKRTSAEYPTFGMSRKEAERPEKISFSANLSWIRPEVQKRAGLTWSVCTLICDRFRRVFGRFCVLTFQINASEATTKYACISDSLGLIPPLCSPVDKAPDSQLAGAGFQAGKLHAVWPIMLYKPGWQLEKEDHTIDPGGSWCHLPAVRFQSKQHC